jgi:hypothetical protein
MSVFKILLAKDMFDPKISTVNLRKKANHNDSRMSDV